MIFRSNGGWSPVWKAFPDTVQLEVGGEEKRMELWDLYDSERRPQNRTEFEERVGLLSERGPASTAYDIVKKYTEEVIGKCTGADVAAHCPSIGRSSAFAALKKLTEEGVIIRQGSGRGTFYVRADSKIIFVQNRVDLDE